MNKQALAFLTMFSLVLMLSVYYVTLPSDATSVMSEDTSQEDAAKEKEKQTEEKVNQQEEEQKPKDEEAQEEQSNIKNADEMQKKIDEKKDEEINSSSSVVSQSDTDENSKKDALVAIDALKAQKDLQGTVRSNLREAGYENAVEIKDQTCIVTVFQQEDSEDLAKTIMMKTSELTNQKYFIEVAFK